MSKSKSVFNIVFFRLDHQNTILIVYVFYGLFFSITFQQWFRLTFFYNFFFAHFPFRFCTLSTAFLHSLIFGQSELCNQLTDSMTSLILIYASSNSAEIKSDGKAVQVPYG